MPSLRESFALAFLLTAAAGCDTQETPGSASSGSTGSASAPDEAASPLNSANAAEPADHAEPTAKAADIHITAVTPEELRQKIDGDKGKAVLVDFWATWCVPCREEYPHTVELSKKHAGDLVVYSVSMDETDAESMVMVNEFLAKYTDGKVVNLQSALGGHEDAYAGFEITGGALPHYKVYDRGGNVVATFGGDVDATVEPEQIDAAVAKAIAE